MKNFKLIQDFGVTALFGTLIIVGTFVIMGMGVANNQVTFAELLPMFGAWVGAIVAAYFTVKAMKEK